MKISNLFHRSVVHCSERDTVEHAASLLWRHDIGCLPVLDDKNRVTGIITDRDICMAALLQGSPLRLIAVSSVMSRDVASCRADDEIEKVIETLAARQLRRLPVVDADNQLIGVVSLNDLARAANSGKLPAAAVANVLVALSAPRSLAASAA